MGMGMIRAIAAKGTRFFQPRVHVFCYQSGYVIACTDRDLKILQYHIEPIETVPEDMTNTPDMLVAEMMMDGSLVYIDTLVMNGAPWEKPRGFISRPVQPLNCRPAMIVRKLWNSIGNMIVDKTHKIDSDGYVCIGKMKTVRIKTPTVDLMCTDGDLYATDAVKTVAYEKSHPDMLGGGVYEMTFTAKADEDKVIPSNPITRLIKQMFNPPDVVSRSFASSFKDSNSTIL